MRDITIDFMANKVVVTKRFYANAIIPATEENEKLRTILNDYPNMKVSVRESSRKSKPNAYKGLTYRYMRKFISVMDNENLDVFERVILHFEGLFTENGEVYAAVRDWFLANYPDHKELIVAAVPTRKAALTSVPTVEVPTAAA